MNANDLEEQFHSFANRLSSNKTIKVDDNEKLQLYGLFKVSTIGRCTQPQPSIFNFVERYKWDAWSSLSDLSREDAMNSYIELANSILGESNVKTFNFINEDAIIDTSPFSENEMTLCYYASLNDFDNAKGLLKEGISIDYQDDEGRTPIMWAADRQHLKMVRFLLDNYADIAIHDNNGQNIFHYACQTDNFNLVELILNYCKENQISYLNLITKGDDDNMLPIELTDNKGIKELMKMLIKQIELF